MKQEGLKQQELFPDMDGGCSNPDDSGETALFELSVDAYYSALYARMSELPIKKEISRFIGKVMKSPTRLDAHRAASDRGDPDVAAVLAAAYKVQHEIHRLTGLLRFTPNGKGMYIARCSPDHYILPALSDHFFLRFGETKWAIIDEKRELCLYRGDMAEMPKLVPLPVFLSQTAEEEAAAKETRKEAKRDVWEDLWRLYHRSVNNEAKKNLRLQQQFMPLRYQKYLPEKGV